MSDFCQKLVVTLLDKGLLAIVVLLVGLWVSKKLEDYKASQQKLAALEHDQVALASEIDRVKRTHQNDFKEKQLSQSIGRSTFASSKTAPNGGPFHSCRRLRTRSPDNLGRKIELSSLVKNHEEIVSLLEASMHLAQADESLAANLAAYIRHVAVYKALRATKTYDLNPIDVGEPLPPELITAITSRLKQFEADTTR